MDDTVRQKLLDRGKLKNLTVALRSIKTANPELAEKIRTEADYFHRNALRMRYPRFRRQQDRHRVTPKTVRLFWTVRSANAIIALRCCQFNDRFEDHWETPRAA